MPLSSRIVIGPGLVHGRPEIRGTRMSVADVLSLLASGATAPKILADYPYMTIGDLRASLQSAASQASHTVLTGS